MNESSFESESGLKIAYRSWSPDTAARGVVLVVPGFNAHSGYYGWMADQLVADGLAVYAIDLRGRGRSDGERFYVQEFDDYVSDVNGLFQIIKTENPGLPIIAFGHSAGGVVADLFALEHQSELAGLICESFAFQVPAPDFVLAVLKGLAHVFPHAHVLKLKNEDFTRDQAALAVMNGDPLIANESQPTQTVAAMVRADERLKKAFPEFTLPLLILHGTADKATKPSGSQLFYDTAGSTDKTIKLYEGHYHDPLSDLGKEAVMADIRSWINEHIQAQSSAGTSA